MNKNFLFLDDNLSRCQEVQSVFPSVTLVHTVSACMDVLRTKHWRILSLDHDLGQEAYVNSNRPDCGMEVIRQLEGHRHYIDLIVIHSMNAVANKKMEEKLKALFYIVLLKPFDPKFYEELYLMFQESDEILT